MLDDLDRELFERGHRFVRYADDVRVFVRSERAAQRVLDSVTAVVERRLKLKVNREKSKVVRASAATLLVTKLPEVKVKDRQTGEIALDPVTNERLMVLELVFIAAARM